MNPDSQAEIRALLESRGLALKKRWGQNFLVNRGAREKLVDLLAPAPGDTVWEIGPGLGSMSGPVLERAARLIAFEVDRGMCRFLTEQFGEIPSFVLVPGDFLETWRGALEDHGPPQRVFGNLPYRSASIMMADIAESGLRPRSMVFTVQRELAERMGSRPGVKSYSSFSVLCQSCFHVADHGDLQPGSFFPPPEVVSSIVELRPREDAPREGNLRMLTALARGLFSARRKTLRNNLGSLILPPSITAEIMLDTLRNQGVDPGCRAEELSPEAFVRLAHALCAAADRGPTGPSTP